MNIWDFFDKHTILAFLIICSAYYVVVRFFRLVMVACCGWPTAHLMDADGDIVHPKPEVGE